MVFLFQQSGMRPALLGEMGGTPSTFTLNADGTLDGSEIALTGAGNVPATDGIYVGTTIPGTGDGPGGFPGYLALGPSPLATTAWGTTANCTPMVDCDGAAISGILPLVADTAVSPDYSNNKGSAVGTNGNGSTPMLDGPFAGSYANFDITSMKLVSFTDTTQPVATLVGNSTIDLIIGEPAYTGGSATCVDAEPLDAFTPAAALDAASAALIPISTATESSTDLTYECTDGSGNVGTVTRTVNVKAADSLITLATDGNGDISPVTQECAVPYVDAGATCDDPEDGPIIGPGDPLANNLFSLDQDNVDANISNVSGPYTATWTCQDNNFNLSTQDRLVNVTDTLMPVVTPNAGTDSFESSTTQNPVTYTDALAGVNDSCEGITADIPGAGTVIVDIPDTGLAVVESDLLYSATDASGNIGTATRTVTVTRAQPVITLVGGGLALDVGDTYIESGMDIIDAQDGDINGITASGNSSGLTYIIDSSMVNTNTPGSYPVTYDVTDNDLNLATQVTRNVSVGSFATGSNFSMLDSNGNVFGGTNDIVFGWDGTTFNSDEEDTNFGVMTIASTKPQPFFSFVWVAHHIRVYGPGSYTFDTTCTVAQLEAGMGSQTNSCDGPLDPGQAPSEQFITMTIPMGQIGAHILFDWNTSSDIDVVNVWEQTTGVWDRHGGTGQTNKLWDGPQGLPPDPVTTWKLISTDFNGDNINASPMLDGPFQGSYANFSAGPSDYVMPPPPYEGKAMNTELGSVPIASVSLWGLLTGLLSLVGLRRFKKKQ